MEGGGKVERSLLQPFLKRIYLRNIWSRLRVAFRSSSELNKGVFMKNFSLSSKLQNCFSSTSHWFLPLTRSVISPCLTYKSENKKIFPFTVRIKVLFRYHESTKINPSSPKFFSGTQWKFIYIHHFSFKRNAIGCSYNIIQKLYTFAVIW